MATSVTLPALGESVTEGTVTRWLKQVGDTVAVDEPLLEISTDKVDTEIPSPVAGTLLEIKVDEDETVEVGAELAVIGDERRVRRAAPAPAADSAEPHLRSEAPAAEAKRRAGPAAEPTTGSSRTEPRAPEPAHEPPKRTGARARREHRPVPTRSETGAGTDDRAARSSARASPKAPSPAG